MRRWEGAQLDKHRHTKDAILYEVRRGNWKPVQYLPRILEYVAGLCKPANESLRSSVDPSPLLHPEQMETSQDGTAIVKTAKHECTDVGDRSFKSYGASNDSQLIIAAVMRDNSTKTIEYN